MKNFIATSINEYLNEQKRVSGELIEIDGVKRPTKNSNGDYIAKDINSITNFYKWFNDSKAVDDKNRPMVYYHVSNSRFNVFKPSRFGKMGTGIYFTSILTDITQHNKYEGSIIYNCYLKMEDPLEIEHPFSKRNDNNDGIIAFKGQSGEEIKVYNSYQIKSVDNDGSWDADDENINS